jgi:hypothetical protein
MNLFLNLIGFVNRFLSLDILRPITRLNITFLLLHTLLFYYRLFTTRDNVELTHVYLVFEYIKNFLLNYFFEPVFHFTASTRFC